ncbi:MAG: plasmid mobilization protein [Isosphaerales bacterium]
MRTTGRPQKSVKDRKAKYLEVRVSESEKQAFQDAADLAGISLSTWVRERLRHVAVRELEAAARPIAFLDHLFGT